MAANVDGERIRRFSWPRDFAWASSHIDVVQAPARAALMVPFNNDNVLYYYAQRAENYYRPYTAVRMYLLYSHRKRLCIHDPSIRYYVGIYG